MAGEEIDQIVEDHRPVELRLGNIGGYRHIHAAKPVIGAFQVGKVGTGFLNGGARSFDQLQNLRQMAQNVGVDLRHAIEVGREADPDIWRCGDHRFLEAA